MIELQKYMKIPHELIPKCPVCGVPMTMNLRCDDLFVQDEGWYAAAKKYEDFVGKHSSSHILLLELGVGFNTPVIIKYPFWRMTVQNSNAVYACVNLGECYCPSEIQNRAICIDVDIGEIVQRCL